MMKNELISVIITVYNMERYLRECVDSVMAQTYQNIEIILVDDGSTDASPDICDEYEKKDNRVHVIHKNNEGAPKARKVGYEFSKGEYLSIIDADDWMEPDMIEKLYRTVVEQNVLIVMCGRFEESGSGSKPVTQGIKAGRYSGRQMVEEIFPQMIVNQEFFEWGIFPSFWDKLFKRETLLPHIMAVDNRLPMGNDAAGVYPCLLNADSIYILDECLYHYRQIAGSMVRSVKKDQRTKEGFRLLYHTVNLTLATYSDIYDLRKQWLEYVLFLMVPRADALYKDFEKMDFLFPFSGVKKGSRVILYGMGTYGQRLYQFLSETKFCNIVTAVDRDYDELSSQGLPVESPEVISRYDYNAIIVTLSFAKARKGVYEYLIEHYPKEKIFLMDEELIKKESTLKAFGLIVDENEQILKEHTKK